MAIRRLERTARPVIPSAPRDRPLPAAFAQEWAALIQGGPVSAKLNMPQAVRLRGRLEIRAIARTLTEIVRRHEVLRTWFEQAGDELLVRIAPVPAKFPLPLIDLSGLPAETREAWGERLANRHANRPFDLHRPPLFIAAMLRLGSPHKGQPDHMLLINMHHILGDGWSLNILTQEFMILFQSFTQGRPSPLAKLPFQFVDFAWWQRQSLASGALDNHLNYWREQLGGNREYLRLPLDRPRPEQRGTAAISRTLVIPVEVANALRLLSRRTGCTVPITLLAAVKVMLGGYSGQRDILVAWASAARNRPELGALIGPFLNTVVIRTDLSGNPTFQELMVRVRKATLSGYDHQELPFITLLREFFPGQKLSRTMMTPVLFNMLQFSAPATAGAAPSPPPPGQAPELTMEQLSLDIEEQAKFDLAFSCTETPAEILLHITGAADVLDPQTMEMIEADCGKLLSRAVQEPQTHVDELMLGVSRRS